MCLCVVTRRNSCQFGGGEISRLRSSINRRSRVKDSQISPAGKGFRYSVCLLRRVYTIAIGTSRLPLPCVVLCLLSLSDLWGRVAFPSRDRKVPGLHSTVAYKLRWNAAKNMESRTNSALFKRAEQLRRWEESETNKEPASARVISRRIQFSDGCVFLSACAAGDKEEVVKLIRQGADIDTPNVDGLTALHQVSFVLVLSTSFMPVVWPSGLFSSSSYRPALMTI